MKNYYQIIERKIIIYTRGRLCETESELITSDLFKEVIEKGMKNLIEKNHPMVNNLHDDFDSHIKILCDVIYYLHNNPINTVKSILPHAAYLLENPIQLNTIVEYLYNYWREFERYVICDSIDDDLDKRPYRTFNQTIEKLKHLVRSVYRDVSENIIQTHPNIYRQVNSGAEFACISLPLEKFYTQISAYSPLKDIGIMRQVLLNPPLILEPSMNKRKGQFQRVEKNPLSFINIIPQKWLCYPALVGDLLIYVYVHQLFYELGFSLCNLFELASGDKLNRKPDAIYLFGAEEQEIAKLGSGPTVFYEDTKEKLFVAACPNSKEFGYFGYLKKMMLTLHNAMKLKQQRMPFHGSLVEIHMKNGKKATVLMIGDSGAGKSETLEAYKGLGNDLISSINIIADDMGSLEITEDGQLRGYGTETGAFLRLDDLKPGYAFGQIDRSIIMSANQVNARIIIPVSDYSSVIKGVAVDYVFYANNYEKIGEGKPVIEKITSSADAFQIFRQGAVMSKGTTTTTGLVYSYFANIFGPVQYKETHDKVAIKFFEQFFTNGIFVGQIRTQLGIKGLEQTGPEIAARKLLELIA